MVKIEPPWWFCCGWWSPWCVIDTLAHKYVPVRWRLRKLKWICDKHDEAITGEWPDD